MHIAIIGAGMSGASAAAHLRSHHTITVFDKARGPGGRMTTRRSDAGGVDLGAQYFTAHDPDFAAAVDDWRQQGLVQPWSEHIVAWEGAHVRASSPQPRFVGTPAMHAPVRALLADTPLHSGHRITSVQRNADGWRLVSESQGEHPETFDAVVLTLPLPQLRELAPPLPTAWWSDWAAVDMPPCWAVQVQWAEQAPEPWDGAFVNDPLVAWLSANHSKPGRRATNWTLHWSEAASRQHLEAQPQAIEARTAQWIQAQGWPNPTALQAHRWRYARVEGQAPHAAYHDASSGLAVAGDWLAGGRVEGAWRSGRAAALAVLASSR